MSFNEPLGHFARREGSSEQPHRWGNGGQPGVWERVPVLVFRTVITSVLSYGAFAQLEAGVEGLIHASEIPLQGNQSLRDTLSEGQKVQVRVLQVDPSHQRLGFSMRLNHE